MASQPQRRVVLGSASKGQNSVRPSSGLQTLDARFTKLRTNLGDALPSNNNNSSSGRILRRINFSQRNSSNRLTNMNARRNFAPPVAGITRNNRRIIRGTSSSFRGGRLRGTRGTIRGRGGRGRGGNRAARRGKKEGTPSKEVLDQEMEEYRNKDPNYKKAILDKELDTYMETREETKREERRE